jgi:hypothetical protein
MPSRLESKGTHFVLEPNGPIGSWALSVEA